MSDAAPSRIQALPRRGDGRALLAAAALLGAGLFLWLGGVFGSGAFAARPSGYYGLQTAGFRSGHLYAAAVPHPALLALKDPYDPVANASFRVLDMAFWKGRYFLYHGVTPILILFWPVAAASGRYPSDACAVGLFCGAAFLAAAGLLARVRRSAYPAAPAWVASAGAACLALASPLLPLAADPQVYEVPIACAALLQMIQFAAVALALGSERRPAAWLALASLCFGLAVGSRPDYLASGIALAIPWFHLARRSAGRTGLLRFGLAALGPAAACGAALALYNWARFGSPAEFGWRYQLSGASQLHQRPFEPAHLVAHGAAYLFGPASWQRYFPFFVPAGAGGFGTARYLPWVWLVPAAFLPPPGGDRAKRSSHRTLVGFVAASTAANFLFISSFFFVADRYAADFGVGLLLLAALGALSLAARAGRAFRACLGCMAVWTIGIGLAAVAADWPRPEGLRSLARLCNLPAAEWERATGRRLGGLALELKLPSGREGSTEPLFETGAAPDRRDWLQITYLRGNRARLGFYHAGLGAVYGPAFLVPPGRRIVLTGTCGSLLPPYEHPAFEGWTSAEYGEVSREVRFQVDGAEALRAVLSCYRAPPDSLRLGARKWLGDGLADRFSGAILSVRRLPIERPRPLPEPVLSSGRPVEVAIVFPSDRVGAREPILSTGEGLSADLLSCLEVGPGRLQFALDHADSGGPEGGVVSFDPAGRHELRVWMGSLAGSEAPASGWAGRCVVLMDGKVVLNERSRFMPADPRTLRIGINPFPSDVVARRFDGLVLAIGQPNAGAIPPPPPPPGEFGAVSLRVLFPRAFGSVEPLVVTGATGAGDIVYVRYEDPRHLRIGIDHWGMGGASGAPVEIDYGKPHRLEISIGSLFPPGGAGPFARRARVRLDGTTVLDERLDAYPSAADEIAIGRNPIGGSTCRSDFTGRILEIARNPLPSD